MTKLIARVSTEFDPSDFEGVVLAVENPQEAADFTEKGYDTPDWEADPIYFTIKPIEDAKVAGHDEVLDVARSLGLDDEHEINELLLDRRVTDLLDREGYDYARELVVVSNYQIDAFMFWKPSSFEAEGPLPLGEADPENPGRRMPLFEGAALKI